MLWCVSWALVTAIGLIGLWVSVNRLRFARSVQRDVEALFTMSRGIPSVSRGRVDQLPAPVQVYATRALGDAPRAIASVRFRHGGRFRTRLDGPWQPIAGEQYDAVDPPGFVWWGRLKAAPGVWVDARDRCLNGKGNMLVALESSIPLFERSGPELDQGAMLRLLSDLVLLPAVLLDDRYVSWQAVDARQARASLRVGGTEVTGTFEFGSDGLPSSFHAERFMDTGAGEPRLLPWSGDYTDYRAVAGLLVPHQFTGYWHIDGARIGYADFRLETLEYDVPEPFQ